ncbi:MAG: nucleotidyl transferase AbiEii/AbiGii toxin family protein [Limisphaerales bacterium]
MQKISTQAGNADIPFLIIGGYAVLAHGYSRTTDDLDLIVQRGRRMQWSKLLGNLGMAIKNDATNFLQFDSGDKVSMEVDLMFVSEDVFEKLNHAAVKTAIEGVQVRVVSLLHLIALKCHSFQHSKSMRRLKDMDDLVQLILVNRLDLNEPELRATILKHGNADTYEKLRHACANE